MGFFVKEKLLDYRKYKLDIWGNFRNSLLINTSWINYSYKKIYSKFYTYKSSLKINSFRSKFRRFKKNIISELIYKLFLIRTLINNVFKEKISKKRERIMMFFFNKKAKKGYYINKRRYFIYETRDVYVKPQIYKFKKNFSTLRITRNFFIMYTYKQLRYLGKKAKKLDGTFEQNYLLLMELKLPNFMYRSSFIPNMFESINFIKNSNVWVNKNFIPLIFYSIKLMDMVGFRILHKGYIYWEFYKRLRRKAFLFLFPRYMYISLTFFLIFCIKIPKIKDIINPINVDMYRVGSYIN